MEDYRKRAADEPRDRHTITIVFAALVSGILIGEKKQRRFQAATGIKNFSCREIPHRFVQNRSKQGVSITFGLKPPQLALATTGMID